MRQSKFNPSPEAIEAAKLVFLAMAAVQTLRPKIEKIQNDLLASMDIRYYDHLKGKRGPMPNEGEKILNVDDLYQSAPGASDAFWAALDNAYRDAGYKDLPAGYCPLLMAENDLMRAKWHLVDEMLPFLPGFKKSALQSAGVENWNKFMELALKLMAPFVRKEGDAAEIINNFMRK